MLVIALKVSFKYRKHVGVYIENVSPRLKAVQFMKITAIV